MPLNKKQMVLVTDIALQFITTELVPRIVSKTIELSKKGSSVDDIVREICSSDFNDVSKGSLKRSASSKAPATTTKTSTAATIDEYMEKHKNSQVCTYVYTRGENKGKICCKPVTSSTYNKDDEKTQRCTTHEDGNPGPGLESLMSKTKTPSKKDQADKVRKTFPKGAPDVLNTSTPTESKAPSGLGKISIKDQLQKDALKIDSKTPTPPPKETTPQPSKRKLPPKTDVKARVVSPTPPKDRTPTPNSKIATRDPTPAKTPTPVRDQTPTPVKSRTLSPEPLSSSSSCNQTPVSKSSREKEHPPSPASSHRESTPDDSEAPHVIPKDENDEEYFLNPTQPSAKDYLWMMYSKNEAVIFSKEFDACYGIYRTDEDINPDKDFKISSAWKKLLKPPSPHQETFVTDRGIEIKSID